MKNIIQTYKTMMMMTMVMIIIVSVDGYQNVNGKKDNQVDNKFIATIFFDAKKKNATCTNTF